MMTLLLIGSLFQDQSPNPQESARLEAVRTVAALAKEVESTCRPTFLTDPPTSIPSVSDFQLLPDWAQRMRNGDFIVDHTGLSGVVRPWEVQVIFRATERPPQGARKRTREECVEIARKVARLIAPSQFELGESYTVDPNDLTGTYILTDVVLKEDPRLAIGRIDLQIDPYKGMPKQVSKRTRWPNVNRDHLHGVLPIERLGAEALRVHGSSPQMGASRIARCQLVCRVPDYSKIRNEMTVAHIENVVRNEAIPMYQWLLVHKTQGAEMNRVVWVDARTGRGIAVQDLQYPYLGGARDMPLIPTLDKGRWRVGTSEGVLTTSANATFEGVPVVFTNSKGEVLTLCFDAKTGLVRDESGTYRPDATLLKALRAEKPVRAFGKKTG